MYGGLKRAFAVVSPYSAPNEHLLEVSYNTLVVCRYQGDSVLWVIDTKSILSVVAMVPFRFLIDGQDNYFFLVEKIGLDVVEVDAQDDDSEGQ